MAERGKDKREIFEPRLKGAWGVWGKADAAVAAWQCLLDLVAYLPGLACLVIWVLDSWVGARH